MESIKISCCMKIKLKMFIVLVVMFQGHASNQNHISSGVKRTKFLFAKTIFLLLKQCSYDFCTHLWKLFTVFQWKSFKFPKFVKACPRDKFFPLSRGPLFISVQFIETSILIFILITIFDRRRFQAVSALSEKL